jgi:hypothetical protein
MVIASIKIELHDDGAMSIEGNVGEYRLCRNMLDSAHDALKARFAGASGERLQTQIVTDPGAAVEREAVRT